ncbi:MAG: excinuclease subunit [Rhizorhabdus sp.]|nr:excinuclease subunit [Rhizorhabdus sp.]
MAQPAALAKSEERETIAIVARYSEMTDRIELLRLRMEEAAANEDFELAKQLRDEISILRGQPGGASSGPIDTQGLTRQQSGSMGLGTSQQRMKPPAGWKPPPKPDPMTKSRSRRNQ